ncbi:MAG TPA: TonB family protein [Rhodocyclaceae bacterium]|nr:TonB family protein [Rhodocyclaceae bacterium]
MTAIPVPMNRSQRNLAWALGISFLLHGVLLMVHFTYPDALTHVTERALDVVLVNSKHSERPEQAQAKAQANLDAGGNTEQEHRASTPLPPSPHTKEGNDLVSAQQRVAQLEALQKQMLTQLKSQKAVHASEQQAEPLPPQPTVSGMDLANRALAVARLEAQIDRQYDEYNKRPRKKFIGTRTTEYLPAQYIEDWRLKVERVGNLNYPEAARGKLYGSLLVYMEINQDGELLRAEVQRSSGQKVLDEAALRILRLAAPFGKFSNEMRQQFDVLAFARTWTFTQADQLSTSNK